MAFVRHKFLRDKQTWATSSPKGPFVPDVPSGFQDAACTEESKHFHGRISDSGSQGYPLRISNRLHEGAHSIASRSPGGGRHSSPSVFHICISYGPARGIKDWAKLFRCPEKSVGGRGISPRQTNTEIHVLTRSLVARLFKNASRQVKRLIHVHASLGFKCRGRS